VSVPFSPSYALKSNEPWGGIKIFNKTFHSIWMKLTCLMGKLLANAKKHGIEVHGYTEETWNEEISKNRDHFVSLIKKT
jgi:hypothetical protein